MAGRFFGRRGADPARKADPGPLWGPEAASPGTVDPGDGAGATAPALDPTPTPLAEVAYRPAEGIIGVMRGGRPLPEVRVPPDAQVIVGRDPSATLVLTDPLVSRRHLLVNVVAGAWEVTDLGSKNPTRLVWPDGREQVLAGAARIAAGQLRIGETVLTLFPIES